MGCKAAETTRNINNAFGPETGNECTGQWRFKKFCKGDKSLEDKKHIGQPSEFDNDQLRAITEADPLMKYTKSYKRTQHQKFYSRQAFEENWKGEKAQLSGCLMS